MRAVTALLVTVVSTVANAGDWPQILGPDRNGIAKDEKLADAWPAGGPKAVWEKPVGDGFSGAAVVGDRLIVFHRPGDDEVIECLNAKTGKRIWSQSFSSAYEPSYTNDRGPRAVPLVHDGRVYLYGARGGLHCVNLSDGKPIWSRNTYEDYSSKRPSRGEPPEGYFGFGSTPIVEGNLLVLNVGGHSKEAGIVAFDRKSGKTVWKATDEKATYSSPVAATIGGQRHLIFVTRLSTVSVDPKNGRTLFRFPFGRLGPAATGANPVVIGDQVFVTGSYNFGAVLARVGRSGSKEIWSSDDVLSSQYTTSILHDGALYGVHGRQDAAAAALRCIDPETRRVHWEKRGFGYATMILADEKLLIMKTDGTLVLAEPTTKAFKELDSAPLFTDTCRALPALADGLLYVRDTKTLKCFDLR